MSEQQRSTEPQVPTFPKPAPNDWDQKPDYLPSEGNQNLAEGSKIPEKPNLVQERPQVPLSSIPDTQERPNWEKERPNLAQERSQVSPTIVEENPSWSQQSGVPLTHQQQPLPLNQRQQVPLEHQTSLDQQLPDWAEDRGSKRQPTFLANPDVANDLPKALPQHETPNLNEQAPNISHGNVQDKQHLQSLDVQRPLDQHEMDQRDLDLQRPNWAEDRPHQQPTFLANPDLAHDIPKATPSQYETPNLTQQAPNICHGNVQDKEEHLVGERTSPARPEHNVPKEDIHLEEGKQTKEMAEHIRVKEYNQAYNLHQQQLKDSSLPITDRIKAGGELAEDVIKGGIHRVAEEYHKRSKT